MATRRANVLGLGLIGGSLALALAKHGFVVSGSDANGEVEQSALARGVIGTVGIELTGVAIKLISAKGSIPTVLITPRANADCSTSLFASLPETTKPCFANASASEPPINPRPRTFARRVATVKFYRWVSF
ncbi:MAG: hypothetical protein ACKOBB_12695 [Acidimicrobiaceae bacterium]